jgi:hypothetical protein
MPACTHDWHIWPETDGLEQRCAVCFDFRETPVQDRFWLRESGRPHRGRDDAIAQAVKQCIHFGFEGVNKPPEGHWLMEMWEFGRSLVPQPDPWGYQMNRRK